MNKRHRSDRESSILAAILNTYKVDPKRFRKYLPEIAQQLGQHPASRAGEDHRSILTRLERERLTNSLTELLSKKERTREKAIRALEYCATLIRDETLPDRVGRKTLIELLRLATNTNIGKITKNTGIDIRQGEEAGEIAILRGIHVHLTWNDRLVAVSFIPSKMKEAAKAMRLVGIARDQASDVAARHDYYLTEGVSPHGG
ncbi:MAG: hypothetical protein HY673_18665 [Chloroflexi bacterium]|nr:hypothetical protein [Chloroflexota bacterium]